MTDRRFWICTMSIAVISVCIAVMPLHAAVPEAVRKVVQKSRIKAEQQDYQGALTLLETAPYHSEVQLMQARIYAWQGNHDQALAVLDALPAAQQQNPDALLIRASIAYYQGQFAAAETQYHAILQRYPGYQDAAAGLERAQRAQRNEERLWRLDAGYEYSNFERRSQPHWQQQAVQLTRFLNQRRTSVHGRVVRHDQFRNIDGEYGFGLSHRFRADMHGYGQASISPEADFRPRWRLEGGGGVRMYHGDGGYHPAVWITVDSRFDSYPDTEVITVNPGIELAFANDWSVAGRYIVVDQEQEKRAYGWDARLHGRLSERLLFYAGYANAPETVAGVTVDTTTVFGGIAVDITDHHTVRLGYARDDRENAYIRNVLNVSITRYF